MTKLQCYKEAARRSGDSPEVVEALFEKMKADGALPWDAEAEVPAAQTEAFIEQEKQCCITMKFLNRMAPDAMRKYVTEGLARNKAQKN